MNKVVKCVYALQFEMERPVSYGGFHLCWLFASVVWIVLLGLHKEKTMNVL